MVSRFGVGELITTIRYLTIRDKKFRLLDYLLKDGEPGWWTADIKHDLPIYNGFFPVDDTSINKFGELMLNDICQIDILGLWQHREWKLEHFWRNAATVNLEDLEPYYHEKPWSSVLRGKKVLVVHPFAKTIERQYQNRQRLFKNDLVLPEFELITIEAVQTIAGNNDGFNSWFQALDHMKSRMEKTLFDIALIGCGAYGMPLAAHAKRLGKQAIHLGGATQTLFGIRGKRWESIPFFRDQLINKYWVRPGEGERPPSADLVEEACYW
jgi:hypothetical protein